MEQKLPPIPIEKIFLENWRIMIQYKIITREEVQGWLDKEYITKAVFHLLFPTNPG